MVLCYEGSQSVFVFIAKKRALPEGEFSLRTTVTLALTASLKFCQNLCSLKWLKPKRSLVSNIVPIGSCIENFYEVQ